MASYALSTLILLFIVSIILSSSSTSLLASNQTTNIGVIINQGSRAGKEQKTAIEIAVQKLNSGSKTHKLAIHFKNSEGDPLEAASSASDLIDKENIQVIVVADTWEETAVVAKIGQRFNIPVISLAADTFQPESRLQWPFLVQMTNQDMHDQIKCIAFIVQSYNWKRVIVVYENNIFGDGYIGVTLLSQALQETGSLIEHTVVVPHFTTSFDPKETIRDNLRDVVATKQSRVFIVLKSSLQAATRVFQEAKELGLVGRDSVWILGDSFSSFLDSLDPSVLQLIQGALGVRKYYSENSTQFLDFKSKFKTVFRSNYPDEDKFEPGIHAVRAYDSIETISLAVNSLRSLMYPGGKKLLDTILSTNFSGLTGKIDFQGKNLSKVFQVVNIIGKSYNELGSWSHESGFSARHAPEYNHSLEQLAIQWPGDVTKIPKGWAKTRDGKKMKIGVPAATSFDRFVKVEWNESSNKNEYSGFCIKVFESVVTLLEEEYGYSLEYEFVNHTGTYDDLVVQVSNKKYDAVVGDVTILAKRSKDVEFTHPFIESGFVMVVPVKPAETHNAWKFMKPFTVEMWVASLCILLYTMFVVWCIEHKVNPEFSGPWKKQFGTAIWFTFSSLFFPHMNRDHLRSNHTKVVVMIWLFVVFIISSSYTASLTSMLTVPTLEPIVRDIDWLRKNDEPVGCDPNSFAHKYLTEDLKLKKVIDITHFDQYRENFKNGTIQAAFLELSSQKYFFDENCANYTIVGPTYKFGDLGFVFSKDTPIIGNVSWAILHLKENGTISKLENEWFGASSSCSSSGLEAGRVRLTSFWGIFLISGLASTLSLLVFLFRLLHNHIKQRLNNRSRWRKVARVVKIAFSLNHNQVQQTESTNEWGQGKPPKWERVSPTEIPEYIEIGRPTQLDIPMRVLDQIGED